jgi:DNA-binding CsgD family transcriptional regulator
VVDVDEKIAASYMISRARPAQLGDILEMANRFAASDEIWREQDGDSLDATAVWQGVVSGSWSVVEQFDDAGERWFVAVKSSAGRPGRPALTERELEIVTLASLGHANKLIGYEVGLSSSAVASQLTSAARKLGVSSRKVLLHAFAVLGEEPARRRTASQHESARRDAPPARTTRFLHGGEEFAVIRIALAPELPSSLTAAERQVTRMIIEGLSNAEIAARRQTSVRTVANQLRSIYAKLAVGSRRQLCSHFSIQ